MSDNNNNLPLLSVRTVARALQLVFSLLGLAFVAAGFYRVTNFDRTSMLGSDATTFAIIANYTCMLYSLGFLVAVDVLRRAARPALMTERVLDILATILSLVAGIALATCDYVQHCDDYGLMLKCGNLTAGTVFTFLGMIAFAATAGMTFMASPTAGRSPTGAVFVDEASATQDGLSPLSKAPGLHYEAQQA